jgi:hypothetical protein
MQETKDAGGQRTAKDTRYRWMLRAGTLTSSHHRRLWWDEDESNYNVLYTEIRHKGSWMRG